MDYLRQAVFEALDNAKENGYNMHRYTAREIAEDLVRCDSDLEAASIDSLMPLIAEWTEKNP